jgi:hypothetical protein
MIVKTYVFLAARYRSRRICRERFPVSLLPAQFGLACTSGMFFSDEEASPQWNQVLGSQYFLSPLSGLIFFSQQRSTFILIYSSRRGQQFACFTAFAFLSICGIIDTARKRHKAPRIFLRRRHHVYISYRSFRFR